MNRNQTNIMNASLSGNAGVRVNASFGVGLSTPHDTSIDSLDSLSDNRSALKIKSPACSPKSQSPSNSIDTKSQLLLIKSQIMTLFQSIQQLQNHRRHLMTSCLNTQTTRKQTSVARVHGIKDRLRKLHQQLSVQTKVSGHILKYDPVDGEDVLRRLVRPEHINATNFKYYEKSQETFHRGKSVWDQTEYKRTVMISLQNKLLVKGVFLAFQHHMHVIKSSRELSLTAHRMHHRITLKLCFQAIQFAALANSYIRLSSDATATRHQLKLGLKAVCSAISLRSISALRQRQCNTISCRHFETRSTRFFLSCLRRNHSRCLRMRMLHAWASMISQRRRAASAFGAWCIALLRKHATGRFEKDGIDQRVASAAVDLNRQNPYSALIAWRIEVLASLRDLVAKSIQEMISVVLASVSLSSGCSISTPSFTEPNTSTMLLSSQYKRRVRSLFSSHMHNSSKRLRSARVGNLHSENESYIFLSGHRLFGLSYLSTVRDAARDFMQQRALIKQQAERASSKLSSMAENPGEDRSRKEYLDREAEQLLILQEMDIIASDATAGSDFDDKDSVSTNLNKKAISITQPGVPLPPSSTNMYPNTFADEQKADQPSRYPFSSVTSTTGLPSMRPSLFSGSDTPVKVYSISEASPELPRVNEDVSKHSTNVGKRSPESADSEDDAVCTDSTSKSHDTRDIPVRNRTYQRAFSLNQHWYPLSHSSSLHAANSNSVTPFESQRVWQQNTHMLLSRCRRAVKHWAHETQRVSERRVRVHAASSVIVKRRVRLIKARTWRCWLLVYQKTLKRWTLCGKISIQKSLRRSLRRWRAHSISRFVVQSQLIKQTQAIGLRRRVWDHWKKIKYQCSLNNRVENLRKRNLQSWLASCLEKWRSSAEWLKRYELILDYHRKERTSYYWRGWRLKVRQRGLLRRVFTLYEDAWHYQEACQPSNFQLLYSMIRAWRQLTVDCIHLRTLEIRLEKAESFNRASILARVFVRWLGIHKQRLRACRVANHRYNRKLNQLLGTIFDAWKTNANETFSKLRSFQEIQGRNKRLRWLHECWGNWLAWLIIRREMVLRVTINNNRNCAQRMLHSWRYEFRLEVAYRHCCFISQLVRRKRLLESSLVVWRSKHTHRNQIRLGVAVLEKARLHRKLRDALSRWPGREEFRLAEQNRLRLLRKGRGRARLVDCDVGRNCKAIVIRAVEEEVDDDRYESLSRVHDDMSGPKPKVKAAVQIRMSEKKREEMRMKRIMARTIGNENTAINPDSSLDHTSEDDQEEDTSFLELGVRVPLLHDRVMAVSTDNDNFLQLFVLLRAILKEWRRVVGRDFMLRKKARLTSWNAGKKLLARTMREWTALTRATAHRVLLWSEKSNPNLSKLRPTQMLHFIAGHSNNLDPLSKCKSYSDAFGFDPFEAHFSSLLDNKSAKFVLPKHVQPRSVGFAEGYNA